MSIGRRKGRSFSSALLPQGAQVEIVEFIIQ